MVKDTSKYIILADGDNVEPFEMPRHLSKINNETLVERTIRLLKENGINDILITAHDKRFDNLGATRYEPLYNDYKPKEDKGYWVSAFPIELLDEPICFLMGDVYYSENAIKTIIKSKTDSILFFCTYQNHDKKYIKEHDEPLGFKVVDTAFFKYHINKMKQYKDSGQAPREPIAWELYRSINNQDLTLHIMTKNYIAINDESCDIDALCDIIKLQNVLGGNMIKLVAIYEDEFTLGRFNELMHITRKNPEKNEKGHIYIGDTFECSKELADYLMGNNKDKLVVAKVIEIEPTKETIEEGNKIISDGLKEMIFGENILKEKPKKKKSSKK